VRKPSFTARKLNRLVDMYCVQWPYLQIPYPNAIYTGLLSLHEEDDNYLEINEENEGNRIAFVTVGTKYDDLIKAIDSQEFIKKLQKLGFNSIIIQRGNGTYNPQNIRDIPGFETKVIGFQSLPHEIIPMSSLVISHAGIGTMYESLQARKKLLVVPNNNHQIEITKELEDRDFLNVTDCANIIVDIDKINMKKKLNYSRYTNPYDLK